MPPPRLSVWDEIDREIGPVQPPAPSVWDEIDAELAPPSPMAEPRMQASHAPETALPPMRPMASHEPTPAPPPPTTDASILGTTQRALENIPRAFGAGLVRTNMGAWGALEAAGDVLGLEGVSDFGRRAGQQAQQLSADIRGPQAGTGWLEQAAYSGVESIGTSLGALAAGVASGNPAATLGIMGTTTGGEAYRNAREAGVPVAQALTYAASQGFVEAATELWPVKRLLGDVAQRTGLFRTVANQLVEEVPQEQLATLLQDLNDWATLTPEKPIGDYLRERPSAAAQTLVATLVATVGQTAAIQGAAKLTSPKTPAEEGAQRARDIYAGQPSVSPELQQRLGLRDLGQAIADAQAANAATTAAPAGAEPAPAHAPPVEAPAGPAAQAKPKGVRLPGGTMAEQLAALQGTQGEAAAPEVPAETPASQPQTGVPYTAVVYRGEGASDAARNRVPAQFAAGRYWTPLREVAATYGPDVREEQVTLTNPYVLRLTERPYFEDLRRTFGTRDPQQITAQLQQAGHDGLIVTNVPVNRGDVAMRDATEVIVFPSAPVSAEEAPRAVEEGPQPEGRVGEREGTEAVGVPAETGRRDQPVAGPPVTIAEGPRETAVAPPVQTGPPPARPLPAGVAALPDGSFTATVTRPDGSRSSRLFATQAEAEAFVRDDTSAAPASPRTGPPPARRTTPVQAPAEAAVEAVPSEDPAVAALVGGLLQGTLSPDQLTREQVMALSDRLDQGGLNPRLVTMLKKAIREADPLVKTLKARRDAAPPAAPEAALPEAVTAYVKTLQTADERTYAEAHYRWSQNPPATTPKEQTFAPSRPRTLLAKRAMEIEQDLATLVAGRATTPVEQAFEKARVELGARYNVNLSRDRSVGGDTFITATADGQQISQIHGIGFTLAGIENAVDWVHRNLEPRRALDTPPPAAQTQPEETTSGTGLDIRGTGETPLAGVPADTGEGAGRAGGAGPDGAASGRAGGPSGPPSPGVGDVRPGGRRPRGPGSVPPGRTDVAEPAGTAAPAPPQVDAPVVDFHLATDPDMGGSGLDKLRDNLAAIRTLRQLQAEGRPATSDEQATLAKYVGWGHTELKKVAFEEAATSLSSAQREARAALDTLLSPEERKAAAASTLNAHYTAPPIARAINEALVQLGFQGGRMLEPAVGTGLFVATLPREVFAKSRITAVELDPTTAAISAYLYPSIEVQAKGLQDATLPNDYFDVAWSNVPFGNYGVADPAFTLDKTRAPLAKSIHNYFFAKALDKVRPGGIVAFITSRYTMDGRTATADQVRNYLVGQADLLAAVRLPANAFEANAGTKVVTDLLILQKRAPGVPPADRSWVEVQDRPIAHDNGYGSIYTPVNQYWTDHPSHILGKEVIVASGGLNQANEYTVHYQGRHLAKDLQALLRKALPAGQYTPERDAQHARTVEDFVAAPKTVKVGAVTTFPDGRLARKTAEGTLEPLAIASPKAEAALRQYLVVRQATRETLRAMLEGADDATLAKTRTTLTRAYDAFVAAHGPLSEEKNWKLFRDDPDGVVVRSLERASYQKDAKGRRVLTVEKAPIFTRRTITPFLAQTQANTPQEALAVSLAQRGQVDLAYMASTIGQTPAHVADALRGWAIFETPDHVWVPADEYLSGDVVTKLAQARAAGLTDNVAALEKVQPRRLTQADITARLGAPWVPSEVIGDFLRETAGAPATAEVTVHHRATDHVNLWTVKADYRVESLGDAVAQFSTPDIGFVDLVRNLLNSTPTTIYDSVWEDGRKKEVKNPVKTQAARKAEERILREFEAWVWRDPERAARLEDLYNDQTNREVVRQVDGSHLAVLPGMGILDASRPLDQQLRPHQKDVIWRGVTGGNMLMAHAVGAGKTFAGVAIAMERRRLGLASKPLFVVPKPTREQWITAFQQLYPQARVLAPEEGDFTPATRPALVAKIATGDWDAVILTHEQFQKTPSNPAAFQAFTDDAIAQLRAMAKTLKKDGADGRQLRQIETAIQRLQARLAARQQKFAARSDKALSFEDLGVDFLFVDEAHYFKNLWFSTQLTGVKGLSRSDADRAVDMFLKVQHVSDRTNARGVIFATGTPVSNSLAELYHMQRYLQFAELKRRGLSHFDAWRSTFADTETLMERTPAGTYEARTWLSRFVNLPELLTMYRSIADVQTAADLKLPVPKLTTGKAFVHSQDATEAQQAFTKNLQTRIAAIRQNPRAAQPDNMLVVFTHARWAAIDMRLINRNTPQDPQGRLAVAATQIADIYHRETPRRGVQLVFLDVGVPSDKGSGRLNLYQEIKDDLISKGVTAADIAFIHDAQTPAAREALQAKVNEGTVRVLLASTAKGGTGINVQRRLVALHHLDVPAAMRPSDVEQREGRILRQGNLFYEQDPTFTVEIHRYVTANSFDTVLWGRLAKKQSIITQTLRGDLAAREVVDFDPAQLSFEEAEAAASGDPRVLQYYELSRRLEELQIERNADQQQRDQAQYVVATYPGRIEKARATETEIAAWNAHPPVEPFQITIRGTVYDKVGEANAALKALLQDKRKIEDGQPPPESMGRFGGESIVRDWYLTTDAHRFWVPYFKYGPAAVASGDPLSGIRSIYKQHPSTESATRAREDAERTLAAAQVRLSKTGAWAHESEYQLLKAEVEGLAQALGMHTAQQADVTEGETLTVPDEALEETVPDTPEEAEAGETGEDQGAGTRRGPPRPQVSPKDRKAAELAQKGRLVWRNLNKNGQDIWDPVEGTAGLTLDAAPGYTFAVYKDEDTGHWIVLEETTGRSISYTEPTRAKALAAAEDKVQQVGLEKLRSVIETARATTPPRPAIQNAKRGGPPSSKTSANVGRSAHTGAGTTGTLPPTLAPTVLRPVPVPELVELARQLQDTPTVVKAFRKASKTGEFRGWGGIRLSADLFTAGNDAELSAVLAHEIGHLIDWLPDNITARGNLIGRLRTVANFLKHTFTGPGGTIKLKDIRAELIALSDAWRPWNPAQESASFAAYRHSAKELYADALSVLLNDPGRLEAEAPIFYRTFFDFLDAKPDVKLAYRELQALLAQRPEDLTEARRERVRGMFARGTTEWQAVEAARREKTQLRSQITREKVVQQLHEKHTPFVRRVKAAQRRGAVIPDTENPVFALEERAYHAGVRRAWMQTHVEPIIADLKAAGLSWEDEFGEVVFYERILGGDTSAMTEADWTAHLQDVLAQRAKGAQVALGGDRSEVANPLGITPAIAQQLHRAMREDLGPAKWAVLQRALGQFRAATKAVADDAYDAGLYTADQKATIDANPAYATWRVVDYLDKAQTSRIRQQIGTLKDITNPATATIEKTLITMIATEHNRVKRVALDFLQAHSPGDIAPAKTRWNGKRQEPVEPDDRDLALVTVFEDGKQVGYYVPQIVGDSLENVTKGHDSVIVKGLRALNNAWFRPIFTTFNVGFQSFNLPRDFIRAWKNTPGMSLARLVTRYGQARHLARARAFGPPTTATAASRQAEQQLIAGEQARVFSLTFNDLAHEQDVEDTQLEALLAQSGLAPEQAPPRFKAAHDILEFIRHVGDYVETLPKAAVMLDMVAQTNGRIDQLTPQQRSDLRRKIGSPDFLAGGTWKPLSNNVLLFSSAITHAWAADLAVATDPKTRGQWLWKTAAFNMAPKLLLFLAASGLLGGDDEDDSWTGELRRLLRRVSEYDLTNYLVVPLGEWQGKTLYLRLPQDDTGRVFGGLVWKALRLAAGDREVWRGLRDVMSYGTGQFPSVSPLIEAGNAFAQYLSGQNPYDAFRGRNVLSQEEQAARDWGALATFLKYEADTLGLSTVTALLPTGRPERPATVMDWVTATPVIGRWLKLSDAGERQALREVQQTVAAEEATQRRRERKAVNATVSAWARRSDGTTPGEVWAAARRIAVEVSPEQTPAAITARVPVLVKKLQMAQARAESDPLTDVVLGSGSTAQKLRVIAEARRDMTRAEFEAWRVRAVRHGVISAEVAKQAARQGPPSPR